MVQAYEKKDVLISIKDVCMSFDGKPVLTNINAEVRDLVRPGCVTGQVIGILGPSGVGKTQLSRIMTGLQEPTSGLICVGADQKKPVRAGLVGYVAQNYPLLRHRTVLGNLTVAARRAGLDATAARAKALEYLTMFDLSDKWAAYPAQLSGGQRQRIAIAQQLLCSEHYLILDEPTTGLDPIMKDKVCGFIQKVASIAEENTIFVISHDINAVLTMADTLWVLGRRRDAQGVSLGASIVQTYDLIERGIAWEADPPSAPAYRETQHEIRALFETL